MAEEFRKRWAVLANGSRHCITPRGNLAGRGGDPAAQSQGEPYNVDYDVQVQAGSVAGVRGRRWWPRALLWHGGPSRSPTDKTPPPGGRRAGRGAASVDPTQLIVDFRDDVSAETLANNGFDRDPDQRLLGARTACTASSSRARAKRRRRWPSCRTIPASRASTTNRSRRIPPDEAEAMRALGRGRVDGGRMPGRRAPGSGFPNDACFKYQWHLRQLGMPDAWKRGNGKGVIVAVIDTGVSKVADLADTKFVRRLQLPRPTTPTPTTTTATAPTSPARSPSRPTTSSASPASPTAPRSCRSRC